MNVNLQGPESRIPIKYKVYTTTICGLLYISFLHYVFRMEHEATQLEKQHVHSVYENTAAYFNDLQSKAWPRVRNFLLEQKPGSLVADIGKPFFKVA